MSKAMRVWTSVGALALIVSLSAIAIAAEKEVKKSEPINDKCPLTKRDINATKTIDVKVNFCCNNCKGKFDKEPGKFLAKVKSEDKCPLSGRDIGDASSTVTFAVCCGNCQKKATAAPYEVIGKVQATEKEEKKKG